MDLGHRHAIFVSATAGSPEGDALANVVEAAVRGADVAVEKFRRPVLAASTRWSSFGMRDPCILTRPEGGAVERGRPVMYFNGRDRPLRAGGRTRVGRATWTPEQAWRAHPKPVFEDGMYAAAGSVLCLEHGVHRLYYSPDTERGFAIAESSNGLDWTRLDGIVLAPEQFHVRRMGLPYVVRHPGRWLMVFEGSTRDGYGIYGASSPDGLAWEPLRDGARLYETDANAWDRAGQANPSLHLAADGRAVILYNGCQESTAFDVGAILAPDLSSAAWERLDAPLLCRGPAGSWDGGRLEGARPLFDPSEPRHLGLLYFGLATPDSYAGGAIGYARFGHTSAHAPPFAAHQSQ